jgi:hypothetical protein
MQLCLVKRARLNGKTPSEVSKIAEPNDRTWESLIRKSEKKQEENLINLA